MKKLTHDITHKLRYNAIEVVWSTTNNVLPYKSKLSKDEKINCIESVLAKLHRLLSMHKHVVNELKWKLKD